MKYLILAVILSTLLCCESRKVVQNNSTKFDGKDYLQPDSVYTLKSMETKLINWDSLPVIQSKTWRTKATFESISKVPTQNRTNYTTTVININSKRKKVFYIEENIQSNDSIRIPKEGYLVQNNDTIRAVKRVLAGKPKTIAVQLNSKPEAFKDIQYMGIECKNRS